jgi:hypothetical protein
MPPMLPGCEPGLALFLTFFSTHVPLKLAFFCTFCEAQMTDPKHSPKTTIRIACLFMPPPWERNLTIQA